MAGFTDTLRSGSWLTRDRARLWAVAVMVASAAGLAYILATATGLNDYQGRPIGSDFSNVYAAGTYVLEGRPEAPFDASAQHAREQEIFGAATPFYGWHYPPFFLFIAALLALLPYLAALAVWQGATLALYLIAIRTIVVTALRSADAERGSSLRFALFLALAFPAVFVNLTHGHNGFLSAALLGLALALLDTRPVIAGVLLGALAYKPQFGLLIPLALIAGSRWTTFAAAAVTVALLALAATSAFGATVWSAFFEGTRFTREVVLEAGGTGWHKIQSVFAWARMWGAPLPVAYAVQMLVSLGVALGVFRLWHSGTSFALKAAGLILATALCTPYSLDYDLMVLAPAIAFWAGHGLLRGFREWEKSVLAALWLMPLIARTVAEYTFMPLAVPLLLIAFVLLLRRADDEVGGALLWPFRRPVLK